MPSIPSEADKLVLVVQEMEYKLPTSVISPTENKQKISKKTSSKKLIKRISHIRLSIPTMLPVHSSIQINKGKIIKGC